MTGKQAKTLLEEDGWEQVRVKGSHHHFKKGDQFVTIPIHGSKDLSKGIEQLVNKKLGRR